MFLLAPSLGVLFCFLFLFVFPPFFDLRFECVKHLQASNHSEYFDIPPPEIPFFFLSSGASKIGIFSNSLSGYIGISYVRRVHRNISPNVNYETARP